MDAPARLLDHNGRPIRRRELTREIATPGITGVRQTWSQSVAGGLTPQDLAMVLRDANEGDLEKYLILAEEMEERDPHYASVLGVRKRAVSGIVPVVEAVDEDDTEEARIAKFVRKEFEDRDDVPDLVEDLLDGLGKGFAVIEHIWEPSGNMWGLGRFERCDPRYFRFDRETGRTLRLIDMDDPVNGIELAPFKYAVHRPRLKSGLSMRGGLARLVAFGWLCKAYALKDWIAFVECYGLPLRVGRYGPEATAEDVEVLHRAVANIGTDAAAVLPRSMEIEFEALTAGAGNNIFETLARWTDEQVSKAVLGQTMTSDDGSSMAQAEVHDNVRHDILRADVRQIEGTINRDLVKPLVDLNFGPRDAYPRWHLPVDEPEDVAQLMTSVVALAKGGMTFKASELRGKLRLKDPDDDDELFGGSTAPAINRALNRRQDAVDEIEAAGLEDWEAQIDPVLTPIERVIRESGSYEEALARLPEALPDMDSSELIASLMRSAFKARADGDA